MTSIAKKLVTNDALTFQWADETATTILFSDFSDDMQTRAMQHGFSQKLGDSYSKTGSVAEAKAQMKDVLDGLLENDWNRKGGSSGGLWVEAYAKATGSTIEETLAVWNDMDKEARKVVCKHPDVIAAKLTIELERLKAKATTAVPITL
jgi:hypothetical protein